MVVQGRIADPVDVVVHRSTLAGCLIALQLSELGKTVRLVTSGFSPLDDYVGALRPWMDVGAYDALPRELTHAFASALEYQVDTTAFFNPHRLAVAMEDSLLDAGVDLIYDSKLGFVAGNVDTLTVPVYGGKFGLVGFPASILIDASHDISVARAMGGLSDDGTRVAQVRIGFGADGLTKDAIYNSRSNGIQLTARGRYLDVAAKCPVNLRDPYAIPRALRDIQYSVLDLVEDQNASGQAALRIAKGGDGGLVYLTGGSLVGSNITHRGIYSVFGEGWESSDIPPVDTPVRLFSRVREIVEAVDSSGAFANAKPVPSDLLEGSLEYCGRDPHYDEANLREWAIRVPVPVVTNKHTVLIAGAGTAGVAAILELNDSGIDFGVIESNLGIGGVHTVGGVSKFWFGNWTPFVVNLVERIGTPGTRQKVPTYLGMYRAIGKERRHLYPGTSCCAVRCQGSRINSVLTVTDGSIVEITADYYLDCTGDGDLAAWGGNPYTYGTERDEMTLWYSFGAFKHGKSEASRHYHSVIDQRSPFDTARGIIVARRQKGFLHDSSDYPANYVATRESRHISCRKRLTYIDAIMNRHIEDRVLTMRSNVDIKGLASSDAVMAGIVERAYFRNWRCGLPFGALVPAKLDNVLVLGKAFGASHDAAAMARMQVDVMSMGGVGAVAVTIAVKHGRDFPEIDMGKLTRTLIDKGILLEGDLSTSSMSHQVPNAATCTALAAAIQMCPLELDYVSALLSNPVDAVPALETEFAGKDDAFHQDAAASVLAILGSRHANHYLLQAVNSSLMKGDLPAADNLTPHEQPDHGWIPVTVSRLNALALTGDSRVVVPLVQLIEILTGTTDLESIESRFDYIYGVAYVAERIASPEIGTLLEKLLDDSAFFEQVLDRSSDPRRNIAVNRERAAYLVLALARALARCGGVRGYEILINFLVDQRSFIARSALTELRTLFGTERGYDPDTWRRLLQSKLQSGELSPVPLLQRFD